MISLRHVSKKFKLYNHPVDRFIEWALPVQRHREFWALRDLSLEIPAGRTVGIVGQNGAGKSTLLKLITGTLLPTEGTLEIRGRVAALLELGTGFHPEFSGRQNIHINGQLLGLGADELQELEPDIIAFSELGPFIDQPVRTYSSGMTMRLGFAIAAALRPELLIVDEALSVGDARFSQKCIRRIREFRDEGATILFVSHDPGAVTTLCDEAVLLERGELRSRGAPRDILDEYRALLAEKGTGNVAMRITRTSGENPTGPRRHGTFQAIVSHVEIRNEAGRASDSFVPGETLLLRARVDFLAPVAHPTVGVLIKDRLGVEVFGTNTSLQKVRLGSFGAGEHVELEFRAELRIGQGDYSITVAVHDDETHLDACYEWTDNAAIFRVRQPGKPLWVGMAQLDAGFSVRRGEAGGDGGLDEALRERFGDVADPLGMEMQRPSPFMSGFGGPQEELDGPGPWRMLDREARFLCHPREPWLALRVSAEADTPVDLTLSSPTAGVLGTARWEGGAATLLFALPDGMVNHVAICDLSWRSLGLAAAPPVRIHGIASHATPPEDEQWPTALAPGPGTR